MTMAMLRREVATSLSPPTMMAAVTMMMLVARPMTMPLTSKVMGEVLV